MSTWWILCITIHRSWSQHWLQIPPVEALVCSLPSEKHVLFDLIFAKSKFTDCPNPLIFAKSTAFRLDFREKQWFSTWFSRKARAFRRFVILSEKHVLFEISKIMLFTKSMLFAKIIAFREKRDFRDNDTVIISLYTDFPGFAKVQRISRYWVT